MNFEGYGDLDGIGLAPDEGALLIRQSDVSSMDLCPAKQGYLKSGAAVQVPSEAMSFGTMMHTFAEQRLLGWDGIATKPQLEAWWAENVERDGFDLFELSTQEKRDASLQEALAACAQWDDDVRPLLNYGDGVLLEERLMSPLGRLPSGREVWAHGTPDVVSVALPRIDDWKTAARGWKDSKAHQTGQASMYSFLVESSMGVLVTEFIYWVWNRKQWQWDAVRTERSPAQIDSFMRHVWMRATQMDAGAFPFTPWQSTFGDYKRGWWCSAKYCAAWDVCEGKHLADDVWEEQTIEITSGWE